MEFSKVTTLLKATTLEAAVLTGRLVLYPSGLVPGGRDHRYDDRKDDRNERNDREGRGSGGDGDGRDNGAGRPVVLLHGLVDNRSVFLVLRRALARHGRTRVACLDYSPFTGDLRTAAVALGRHVDRILERTGRAEVDVVGHSLGGLIARYYVQRLGGDARVRTLVTLGTPHAGTTAGSPLADAHPLVRQMRPGSEVLRELAEPAPGCRTRFVSFWSDLDRIMVPVETARLDHPDLLTHSVRVSGIGHLALPVHPTVAAGVLEALDAEGAGGAEEAAGEGAASVA